MKTRSSFLIFIIFLLFSLSCRRNADIVSPVIAPITEAVFASGHIEPKDQFMLEALNDGYLKEVRVVENAVVKAGQVLFVQDFTNPYIQESAAKQNLVIAKENYEEHSCRFGPT